MTVKRHSPATGIRTQKHAWTLNHHAACNTRVPGEEADRNPGPAPASPHIPLHVALSPPVHFSQEDL
jgi:hypothetical protein